MNFVFYLNIFFYFKFIDPQVAPVMYVDPNRMGQPPMMKLNMPNMPNPQQKFPLKPNFKQQGMKQNFNPMQVNQMNQMNPNPSVHYGRNFIQGQGQMPIAGQKIMPQQVNMMNPFVNNQMNKNQVSQITPNVPQQTPQPKQSSADDQNELEDVAAEIYEVVESKYPE
jgi:hypothetical protein